jgi:hypothetical protein
VIFIHAILNLTVILFGSGASWDQSQYMAGASRQISPVK